MNTLFESFMFICIENMFDIEKVVCIKITWAGECKILPGELENICSSGPEKFSVLRVKFEPLLEGSQ